MKVAIFVHCFFPEHFYGTETYTLELAKRLMEMGHEVTVVAATFQGEPAQDRPVHRYTFEGIPVLRVDKNFYPHGDFAETYYQPSMRPALREILTDLRPDVVHVTHLINHTAVLLEEVRELEIPLVATFTDFFGFCLTNRLEAADGSLCAGPRPDRSNCVACAMKAVKGRPEAGRLGRLIPDGPTLGLAATAVTYASRLPILSSTRTGRDVQAAVDRPETLAHAYEAYAAAIAPTRFLRRAYERNGITVPMHDVPFGVDTSRDPKPARSVGDGLVIGYIGQIAPHKGIDLLVDAFVGLGPVAAELEIFGAEDQDPAYMERLRSAAAGKTVSFRGTFPKEQMAAVLARLDLLVIPSRWYENSPLVLLNGLATHTPVLVSDVEGMTEFLEPGRNGFTFKRSDRVDLARILKAIVEDPVALRAMTRTTDYPRTTRAMAEEVVAIYERVA